MMEKTKIRNLEEEIDSLKLRLKEKVDEGLKIWERDFYVSSQIDDFLSKKDFGPQGVTKILNDIKRELTVPDDFKKPTINKDEVNKLNIRINKLEAEIKLVDSKHLMLQTDYQKKTRENENLCQKIKDLELENNNNKSLVENMKADYRNDKLDLLVKLDRVTDERNLSKYKLKKLNENVNNDENKGIDKMTIVLNKAAKLEGRVNNLVKENKELWEKMEFYRRLANI